MKTLRPLLCVAALTCCIGTGSARQTSGVAPLRESEFDEFSQRTAQQIEATLRRDGYSMPLGMPMPELLVQSGVEFGEQAMLTSFAKTLADGLNDRMAGQVRFAAANAAGRIKASVAFGGEPSNEELRRISFVLTDEATHSELLRETISYRYTPGMNAATARRTDKASAPAKERTKSRAGSSDRERRADGGSRSGEKREDGSAAPTRERRKPRKAERGAQPDADADPDSTLRSRTDPDRSGSGAPGSESPMIAESGEAADSTGDHRRSRVGPVRIRISRAEGGLAELLDSQVGYFRDHTIDGSKGTIIFLDDRSWARLKLMDQRTYPTRDDHLRVELDLVARETERGARIRVVFMDAEGKQLDVTPVLRYHFLPEYASTVAITSKSRNAAKFYCLVEYD